MRGNVSKRVVDKEQDEEVRNKKEEKRPDEIEDDDLNLN